MADAAVQFLLENLSQLIADEVFNLRSCRNEMEYLHNELSLMNALLRDCTNTQNHEIQKEILNQMKDVVYDAEDVIDSFIFEEFNYKSRSFFSKLLHRLDHSRLLHTVEDEIRSIRAKLKKISKTEALRFKSLEFGVRSGQVKNERKLPTVEEDGVVGFDDEAGKIIELLTGGSVERKVISITGMGGIGKTTLAKMIYHDTKIEYEFEYRAWVTVSANYGIKDLHRSILNSFIQPTEILHDNNNEAVTEELCSFLSKKKYLIVLDDVWSKEAWDDIKIAFPENNERSRILITSRMKDLGWHANPNRGPHELRFLNCDESWMLLRRKALGVEHCPPELMKHGLHIAKECQGLPLAIVVIGGMLLGKNIDYWEKVAKSMEACTPKEPANFVERALRLSYYDLPCDLQSCFLYLSSFPEDFEIPVGKLFRLWMAEGFIQSKMARNLEEMAEDCLGDLINRSLVIVRSLRSNGRVKTCSVLKPVHEFCKREALGECFLQEIEQFNRGTSLSSDPPSKRPRRLSIHSNLLNYISRKPFGPQVRTFFSSSPEDIILSTEHISSILRAFKLLRVLDAPPIIFTRFPVGLSQLVMLRYITISGHFKILPAALSSLWNLQTLVVETSSKTLEIKADLWKLIRLRYVKTNASTTLPSRCLSKTRKIKDEDSMIRNILALSTISPESCTEDVLARIPYLKTLGIRGRLSKFLENKKKTLLFDLLREMAHLQNLKLLNDVFPRPPSEGKLGRLPQSCEFPPRLTKLTLAATWLDWMEMSTLGMLENLEILKLNDNAFMGEEWQPNDGGFRSLRFLLIGRTDLVTWKASAHHFPKLEHLSIRNCSNLKEVPSGFADIPGLQLLDLRCTTKSAVASAVKIQQKKLLTQDVSTRNRGFVLSVHSQDY